MLVNIAVTIACTTLVGRVATQLGLPNRVVRAFNEGRKLVINTELVLQNAINWNILQRDTHKRASLTSMAAVRAEELRHVRRHQRNIDQLNAQLRSCARDQSN